MQAFNVNTSSLKKGMRVAVRHKYARDVHALPGGPIEEIVDYLPGVIVEERLVTGRQEFKVRLDKPHPTGQEWFWRGLVYPEGSVA